MTYTMIDNNSCPFCRSRDISYGEIGFFCRACGEHWHIGKGGEILEGEKGSRRGTSTDRTVGFYCPRCGENTDIPPVDILPGNSLEIICPECKSVWEVDIEFKEIDTDG